MLKGILKNFCFMCGVLMMVGASIEPQQLANSMGFSEIRSSDANLLDCDSVNLTDVSAASDLYDD